MSIYQRKRQQELMKFEVQNVQKTNRILGMGAFGFVEELVFNGQHVAGKSYHKELLDPLHLGEDTVMRRFTSESNLLSKVCRHSNIVTFLGLCKFQHSAPIILMELLHCNLDTFISNSEIISLDSKFHILFGIAKGLAYLHGNTPPLVHRDLTSHNILLNEDATAVKIADLANVLVIDPEKVNEAVVNSPVYMPPEAIGDHPSYGPPLDIFSFGHLALYTMIERFPGPLPPKCYQRMSQQLLRTELERRKTFLDILSANLVTRSPIIVEVIERSLEDSPLKRPDAPEVVELITTQITHGSEVYESVDHEKYDQSVNSILQGESQWLEMYSTGRLRISSWKDYIFKLEDSMLTYKKSNMKDVNKIPVSSITSVEANDSIAHSDRSKFYFKIHISAGHSPYLLRATSKQIRSNWMNAITQRVKQEKRKSTIQPITFTTQDYMPVSYQAVQHLKRNSLFQSEDEFQTDTDQVDYENISINPAYHRTLNEKLEPPRIRKPDDSLPSLPLSITSEESYEYLPTNFSPEKSRSHKKDDLYEDVSFGDSGAYCNEDKPPPIPPRLKRKQSLIAPVTYRRNESSGSEEYVPVENEHSPANITATSNDYYQDSCSVHISYSSPVRNALTYYDYDSSLLHTEHVPLGDMSSLEPYSPNVSFTLASECFDFSNSSSPLNNNHCDSQSTYIDAIGTNRSALNFQESPNFVDESSLQVGDNKLPTIKTTSSTDAFSAISPVRTPSFTESIKLSSQFSKSDSNIYKYNHSSSQGICYSQAEETRTPDHTSHETSIRTHYNPRPLESTSEKAQKQQPYSTNRECLENALSPRHYSTSYQTRQNSKKIPLKHNLSQPIFDSHTLQQHHNTTGEHLREFQSTFRPQHCSTDSEITLETLNKKDPIEIQTFMLLKMEQALQAMQAYYAYMSPESESATVEPQFTHDYPYSITQKQVIGSTQQPVVTNTMQHDAPKQSTTHRNPTDPAQLMSKCLEELLKKTPLIASISEKLLVTGDDEKSMPAQLKKLARANSDLLRTDVRPSIGPLNTSQKQANYITSSQIFNKTTIGQGQFGEISTAELQHRGSTIKVCINTVKTPSDKEHRKKFFLQQATLAEIMHPNIARYFSILDEEPPMILTEILPNGDLKTFLMNNKRPIQMLLNYMLDVSMGMHHLAQMGLVHRNIAARSIIVGKNEKCKVSNLTYIMQANEVNGADISKEDFSTLVRWMAPESIASKLFSAASDVWSFGVLQWEMKNPDKEPYSDMDDNEVLQYISGHSMCLLIPNDYPHQVQNIMKACWQKDPLQRPSFLLIAHVLTDIIS